MRAANGQACLRAMARRTGDAIPGARRCMQSVIEFTPSSQTRDRGAHITLSTLRAAIHQLACPLIFVSRSVCALHLSRNIRGLRCHDAIAASDMISRRCGLCRHWNGCERKPVQTAAVDRYCAAEFGCHRAALRGQFARAALVRGIRGDACFGNGAFMLISSEGLRAGPASFREQGVNTRLTGSHRTECGEGSGRGESDAAFAYIPHDHLPSRMPGRPITLARNCVFLLCYVMTRDAWIADAMRGTDNPRGTATRSSPLCGGFFVSASPRVAHRSDHPRCSEPLMRNATASTRNTSGLPQKYELHTRQNISSMCDLSAITTRRNSIYSRPGSGELTLTDAAH